MIVGRDPAQLDSPAVARAALESLGENTSDGIIAPLFWGMILGLPGIAAYKAINTLDSMIGHKTPRYIDFGWFSARLDDWVNLIPVRPALAGDREMGQSPLPLNWRGWRSAIPASESSSATNRRLTRSLSEVLRLKA
jgi:cobalamin biosynthesis protein CobD/CbiB